MSGNIQTNENLPGGRQQDDVAAGGNQQTQADLEKLARSNGWRPKAEFRGVGEWVDAAEYLRRNEEHLPIIKGRLKKTEAQLEAMRGEQARTAAALDAANEQIAASRQATNDIKEMLTTAEDRMYRRAVAELGQKMETAIADGDVAGARAARVELEQVTEEARKRAEKAGATKKTEPDATKPRVDPAATAWIAAPEQSWYREIRGAKGWAEQLFVDDSLKHLPVATRLTKISELAAEEFGDRYPKHFKAADDGGEDDEAEPVTRKARQRTEDEDDPERAGQRRVARVGSPRSPAARDSSKEPTFEDIPAEAKAKYYSTAKEIEAYAKSKGRKDTFTKDEFLASFKAAGGFDNKE